MWRDSFAVPSYACNPEPSEDRRSLENSFLLNVERQASQLRRTDSASFIRAVEVGSNIPFREALLHQKHQDDLAQQQHVKLMSQTPMDSSLPTVGGMFEHRVDDDAPRTMVNNPLVPQTPPHRRRKHGSLVSILKAFHIDPDASRLRRQTSGDSAAQPVQEERYKYDSEVKLESDYEVKLKDDRSTSLKHSESSDSDDDSTTNSDEKDLSTITATTDEALEKAVGKRNKVKRALKKSLSFVMSKHESS